MISSFFASGDLTLPPEKLLPCSISTDPNWQQSGCRSSSGAGDVGGGGTLTFNLLKTRDRPEKQQRHARQADISDFASASALDREY